MPYIFRLILDSIFFVVVVASHLDFATTVLHNIFFYEVYARDVPNREPFKITRNILSIFVARAKICANIHGNAAKKEYRLYQSVIRADIIKHWNQWLIQTSVIKYGFYCELSKVIYCA